MNLPGPAKPTAEVAVGLEWMRTSLKIGLGKKLSRAQFNAYVLCSLSSMPITTTCFSDDDAAISKTTTTTTPQLSLVFTSLPSNNTTRTTSIYQTKTTCQLLNRCFTIEAVSENDVAASRPLRIM